jgi:hypothetical protein
MMIMAFASVYDIINIVQPMSFGKELRVGFSSYSESVYYSIHSLIKLEDYFPNASRLMKNISIIETVWGDLFLALLVGNLLNKPAQLKTKEPQLGDA